MTVAERRVVRRHRPGKAAILRAAVTVMGEDGYEGASMRDIAKRAGVSPAAIYHHFSSKRDMLREFLEDAWRIVFERIESRLATAPDDPVARLDEVVSTLVASQHHDEYARLAAVVALREYVRLAPDDRAEIERRQQRLLQLLEGVLAQGVASGDFTTPNVGEAARAILAVTSPAALVGPDADHPMAHMIELAQRFARQIARAC